MSHGTEQKQVSTRQAQEVAKTPQSNPSHSAELRTEPEITRESLQTSEAVVRKDSTLDNKLSVHLDQYRETLTDISPITDRGLSRETQKSDVTSELTSNPKGNDEKALSVKKNTSKDISIIEDPIGFLANLLKRFERFLLRSLDDKETMPNPTHVAQDHQSIPHLKKKKRKKKYASTGSNEASVELYNLQHLSEGDEPTVETGKPTQVTHDVSKSI